MNKIAFALVVSFAAYACSSSAGSPNGTGTGGGGGGSGGSGGSLDASATGGSGGSVDASATDGASGGSGGVGGTGGTGDAGLQMGCVSNRSCSGNETCTDCFQGFGFSCTCSNQGRLNCSPAPSACGDAGTAIDAGASACAPGGSCTPSTSTTCTSDCVASRHFSCTCQGQAWRCDVVGC